MHTKARLHVKIFVAEKTVFLDPGWCTFLIGLYTFLAFMCWYSIDNVEATADIIGFISCIVGEFAECLHDCAM